MHHKKYESTFKDTIHEPRKIFNKKKKNYCLIFKRIKGSKLLTLIFRIKPQKTQRKTNPPLLSIYLNIKKMVSWAFLSKSCAYIGHCSIFSICPACLCIRLHVICVSHSGSVSVERGWVGINSERFPDRACVCPRKHTSKPRPTAPVDTNTVILERETSSLKILI